MNEEDKMKSLKFEKSFVSRLLQLFSHQDRRRCTRFLTKVLGFSTKVLGFCIVNLALHIVAQRDLRMKSLLFRLREFYIQKRIDHSRIFRTCTFSTESHFISDDFQVLII